MVDHTLDQARVSDPAGSSDPKNNKVRLLGPVEEGGEKHKHRVLVVPAANDRNKAIGRNDKVYKHILPRCSNDKAEGNGL